MENRELGIVEIYDRLEAKKDTLGLNFCIRTPTGPIDPTMVPGLIMNEGDDVITQRANRGPTGYPAKRILEVAIELLINDTDETIDLKTLFLAVKRAVFYNRDIDNPRIEVQVANNVFINENRTEGPYGFGLPNIKGMKLVLDLIYTDNGI